MLMREAKKIANGTKWEAVLFPPKPDLAAEEVKAKVDAYYEEIKNQKEHSTRRSS
jgi:hypothetical protein